MSSSLACFPRPLYVSLATSGDPLSAPPPTSGATDHVARTKSDDERWVSVYLSFIFQIALGFVDNSYHRDIAILVYSASGYHLPTALAPPAMCGVGVP